MCNEKDFRKRVTQKTCTRQLNTAGGLTTVINGNVSRVVGGVAGANGHDALVSQGYESFSDIADIESVIRPFISTDLI